MSELDRLLALYNPGTDARFPEGDGRDVDDRPRVTGDGWDRDMILPVARRETQLTPQPPEQWLSAGDVMRTIDAREGNRWQIGYPKLMTDVGDAANAVAKSSFLAPIERPSTMGDDRLEEVLGHAGSVVGPMMATGYARAAMKPSGGSELGIFGGRLGADRLADQGIPGPKRVLDQLPIWEAQGKTPDEIWALGAKELHGTPYAGPMRGTDKKERFEIDDSAATLDFTQPSSNRVLQHPRLTDAYPSARDSYVVQTPGLVSSALPLSTGRTAVRIGADVPDKVSHGLHEFQHHLQGEEGFARGANVDGFTAKELEPFVSVFGDDKIGMNNAAFEAYRRTAGEVEARAVQQRRHLSPDQRAARPPWLDYDVPDAQQIVRFGGDGPQHAIVAPPHVQRLQQAGRIQPGARGSMEALEAAKSEWAKGNMDTWAKHGWESPEATGGVIKQPFAWHDTSDIKLRPEFAAPLEKHREGGGSRDYNNRDGLLQDVVHGRGLDDLMIAEPGLRRARAEIGMVDGISGEIGRDGRNVVASGPNRATIEEVLAHELGGHGPLVTSGAIDFGKSPARGTPIAGTAAEAAQTDPARARAARELAGYFATVPEHLARVDMMTAANPSLLDTVSPLRIDSYVPEALPGGRGAMGLPLQDFRPPFTTPGLQPHPGRAQPRATQPPPLPGALRVGSDMDDLDVLGRMLSAYGYVPSGRGESRNIEDRRDVRMSEEDMINHEVNYDKTPEALALDQYMNAEIAKGPLSLADALDELSRTTRSPRVR